MAMHAPQRTEPPCCARYSHVLSALLAWDLVRDNGVKRRACLFRAWDDQYFVLYDDANPTRSSEIVLLTIREARTLYDKLRVHALDRWEAFPGRGAGND